MAEFNEQSGQAGNARRIFFAAIDKAVESNIISPTETTVKDKGHDLVSWGDGNTYPEYLLELYRNCPTLRSIISGCVDFATGDDVTSAVGETVNRTGETPRDIVKKCMLDWYLYGGFALQVIRDLSGTVSELYWVDMRYLRMDKECNVFYYSEEYGQRYRRSDRVIVYPKFMASGSHPSSIVYVKNTHTQTYPSPLYAASVKACETERAIDTFHLNAINNGFVGSMFVNFNNGTPTQEIMNEIEDDFNEKFAGAENALRIGFSWNADKEHATTFEQFKVEDFAAQYEALATHCRQQIFTSFRAVPALFGIIDKTGFNSVEYESAFKLFNRTQVRPVQDLVVETFRRIYGRDAITIAPFTLG